MADIKEKKPTRRRALAMLAGGIAAIATLVLADTGQPWQGILLVLGNTGIVFGFLGLLPPRRG